MYIFIDESGIHKQDGKSTTALVYVEVEHLEKLNKTVLNIEQALKIEPFHWNKQIWKVRSMFFEAIEKEPFAVKVFIFQNPFTQEKLENALKHLLVEKDIKNIIIDGKRTRQYTLNLKKILRDSGISVRKVRMGNDIAYPCLRIADLFAGLVRAYENDPYNVQASELYKRAKNKITIHLRGWSGAG